MKTIYITSFTVLCSINLFGQWMKLPNLTSDIISVYQSNNVLLAGTSNGIYYSTNNGNTWTVSTGITTVAKSFTKQDDKVLVSSYEKLYQSSNDGILWTALPTINTNQEVNNIIINDTKYIAGMNGSGIYLSVDNGSSWSSSSSSWYGKNTDIKSLKDLLFASYHGSGYLEASTTNGQTWYSPYGNGIKIESTASFQDIYTLATMNDSILIAGTKNNSSFSSYDGVYFSYDLGNNWTKKVNGITTTAINSIAVAGNLIFAGTNGGGVFYSTDCGNSWSELNNGLTNFTINKLYINGSELYAGVSTGLFKIDICNLLQNTSTLTAIGPTVVTSVDSVKLFANLSGSNYQWFLNETVIPDYNNNVFFAKSTGNYKVVITYSSNCYDTTNIVDVTVNSVGIKNELITNLHPEIYPNPSSGIITLQLKSLNLLEQYEIQLYNTTGKLVKSLNVTNNITQLSIEDLQSGVYYIIIRNGTKVSSPQKIILMK